MDRISQRRGALLTGVFVVAAWFVYPFFRQSSAPVQSPALLAVKPAAVSDNRPVMPQGFRQQFVIRDPFLMPQEALPPNAVASSNKGNGSAAASPLAPMYRVTGIAIGNGTAAVILESNAGSRSYRIGEYAGQYQICDITADAVLLAGPDGSHLLNMRGRIE
jgi:hypothetical protein